MPEINFFWDPLSDNILQERDETGAVTAEYTAEPGLYGNIISQNRGGVESQFHYDAQGAGHYGIFSGRRWRDSPIW